MTTNKDHYAQHLTSPEAATAFAEKYGLSGETMYRLANLHVIRPDPGDRWHDLESPAELMAWRHRHDLTSKQAAAVFGVTPSYLMGWEAGRVRPGFGAGTVILRYMRLIDEYTRLLIVLAALDKKD